MFKIVCSNTQYLKISLTCDKKVNKIKTNFEVFDKALEGKLDDPKTKNNVFSKV